MSHRLPAIVRPTPDRIGTDLHAVIARLLADVPSGPGAHLFEQVDRYLRPGPPISLHEGSTPRQLVGARCSPAADGLVLIARVEMDKAPERAVVASVDRSGSAWATVIPFGRSAPLLGEQIWLIDNRPSGLVIDALLRATDCATPPPEVSTSWFWLSVWLWELLAEGNRQLLPTEVASLHPAIDFEEVIGLDDHQLASFCFERHRDHVHLCDWEALTVSPLPTLDPVVDLAGLDPTWHDAGSLSRFAADSIPGFIRPFTQELASEALPTVFASLSFPSRRLVAGVIDRWTETADCKPAG